MIKAFGEDLTFKVARLLKQDKDFRDFSDYIVAMVTDLAIQSTSVSGDKGEQLKGASLAFGELRDMILGSKQVVEVLRERMEMGEIDRDYMSP